MKIAREVGTLAAFVGPVEEGVCTIRYASKIGMSNEPKG